MDFFCIIFIQCDIKMLLTLISELFGTLWKIVPQMSALPHFTLVNTDHFGTI